jgi:hypothetical protein
MNIDMAGSGGMNTSVRKTISALLLLGLLAFLLFLYFLKYVPAQRTDFHRRAFLELGQIERAIQERNTAYINAINTSIDEVKADDLASSPLVNYFRWNVVPNTVDRRDGKPVAGKDFLAFQKIAFDQKDTAKDWQLSYLLTGELHKGRLSVKVDSFLQPIVSTYKDIFADYLLIVDTSSGSVTDGSVPQDKQWHKGNVLFNSGYLSVDDQVDMDTLLKKPDGFSLLNVHDVKIQGNPYKLFLYPIQLYNQHAILAGLISLDRYKQGSEAVPLDLITVGSILVLLLLLNLPLLKIYIIGPIERITSVDIRMIIISYFLAAFMIFFLFFLLFLSLNQTNSNQSTLTKLGDNIQHDFYTEINDICHQLGQYDTLYTTLHLTDSKGIQNISSRLSMKNAGSLRDFLISGNHLEDKNSLLQPLESLDNSNRTFHSDTLNAFFHPTIYPQMDIVFWVSDEGKWVARWAFKKQYQKTHRLNVSDRPYFKDIKNNNLLSLPLPYDTNYAFSIQPTLSRLNGNYNINVAIKSHYTSIMDSFNRGAGPVSPTGPANAGNPVMLGMGTEMNSIYSTIMPPGYSFSIINDKGEILYDSKPGRCLLSNLFVEAGDNTDIQQCAHYRYTRFFKQFTLKGRQVALLSKPLPNLPYTLIVYYNLSINNEFEFHSLSLACFCMACILALITLTAFFNEWGKRKPSLLSISPINFDWLHPVPEKMAYYQHHTVWMWKLFGIYGLAWCVIELFFPRQEPCLFIISLSLPFFVANHYYVVREKYYLLYSRRPAPDPAGLPLSDKPTPVPAASLSDKSNPSAAPVIPADKSGLFAKEEESTREILTSFIGLLRLPSFLPLGLVMLVILVYLFATRFNWGGRMIILAVFLIFGLTIFRSARNLSQLTERPSGDSFLAVLIKKYVLAILTGVLLITLIPATGLFALFYKEETNSELKMLKLNMARAIQSRRCLIDRKIPDYAYGPEDDSFLYAERFRNGIYLLDSLPIQPLRLDDTSSYHTFSGYTSLHKLLFSIDSTTLEPPDKKEEAGDRSWNFYQNINHDTLMLFYGNRRVSSDAGDMYFPIDPVTEKTAFGLIWNGILSMGPLFLFLVLVGFLAAGLIAYILTASLARHIFLLDVLARYRKHSFANPYQPLFLKSCTKYVEPDPFVLSPDCIKAIRDQENRIINGDVSREADILQAQHALEKMYDEVWKAIPTDEKYILYDFALDGFTNYKAGILLYKLLQKGLLRIDEDLRLEIMSHNFHNYLLSKDIFNKHLLNKDDIEVYTYMKNAKKQGSWQAFRVPLHIILAGVGLFVFLTQDALYQKMIGLFASIPSLMQMLMTFFEKSNGKDADVKDASDDPYG